MLNSRYVGSEVSGLCRKNVARVALVAFLVGMMVLGYCSYMLPDSVWQEQTLTPFAYSTLCLFRELAMLTAGLSIAVLARSRTAYRLTRPLAVKIVLFALALIPLLYLSEMRYTLTTLVLLTPYIIALLMLAPTLVRWLVKALKRF